jgi:hypothetical protein
MARKISARDLIADIRAGLQYADLAEKHGLSDQGMDRIVAKLVTAGLVGPDELPKKPVPKVLPQPPETLPPRLTRIVESFKCPSCGTVSIQGDQLCVKCGGLLGHDSDKRPDSGHVGPGPDRDQRAGGFWRSRAFLACVGLAVAIVVGGVWWTKRSMEERRRVEFQQQQAIEEQRRVATQAEGRRREAARMNEQISMERKKLELDRQRHDELQRERAEKARADELKEGFRRLNESQREMFRKTNEELQKKADEWKRSFPK